MTISEYNRREYDLRRAYTFGEITWAELDAAVYALRVEAGLAD